MREFFCGWRRKIGCVTLVMACLGMAGWARSVTITDNIELPFRGRTVRAIESSHGELLLVRSEIEIEQEIRTSSNPEEWQKARNYPNKKGYGHFGNRYKPRASRIGLDEVRWYWKQWGIGTGERRFLDYNLLNSRKIRAVISDTVWVISYQSITIPLTALSAFLLLTKPRNSTQKKTDEPVRNESGWAAT